MGCFNVTCSVLRTPIRENDKCRAIVLKDPDLATLASGEHFAFESLMRASLHDIVSGRYDDYGGITDKGRWGYGAVDQAWFISEAAWQEGVKLLASTANGWIKNLFGLETSMSKLEQLLTEYATTTKNAKVLKALKDSGPRIVPERLDDIRVLAALYWFCRSNGLNLFDPAMTTYCTQSTFVEERTRWMELRGEAINRLNTP